MNELLQHGVFATPATTVGEVLLRLIVASALGGIIGLERQFKHRSAGLRTNLFICFGSALFTILSSLLSGSSGDQTRIAAQIIAGIGFIGAGSILHQRGGVQGLTTAATIFVVAGIGMCAGGGLLLPATLATVLVLFGLMVLGVLEKHVFVASHVADYQATGPELTDLYAMLRDLRADKAMRVSCVATSAHEDTTQLSFTLEASAEAHRSLQEKLEQQVASHILSSYSTDDQE